MSSIPPTLKYVNGFTVIGLSTNRSHLRNFVARISTA